jgi:hypothetical protein
MMVVMMLRQVTELIETQERVLAESRGGKCELGFCQRFIMYIQTITSILTRQQGLHRESLLNGNCLCLRLCLCLRCMHSPSVDPQKDTLWVSVHDASQHRPSDYGTKEILLVGLTRAKRGWKETFLLDDSLSGNTVTLNWPRPT